MFWIHKQSPWEINCIRGLIYFYSLRLFSSWNLAACYIYLSEGHDINGEMHVYLNWCYGFSHSVFYMYIVSSIYIPCAACRYILSRITRTRKKNLFPFSFFLAFLFFFVSICWRKGVVMYVSSTPTSAHNAWSRVCVHVYMSLSVLLIRLYSLRLWPRTTRLKFNYIVSLF